MTPRRSVLKIVLIAAVIILAIISGSVLLSRKGAPSSNVSTVKGGLTVGAIPFVYPCTAASESNFASAFGLSNNPQDFQSVQETSVLSPSQIPIANPPTNDLLKIIPDQLEASGSIYATCELTGTIMNSKTAENIEVNFSEFSSTQAAQSDYSNLNSAARSTDTTAPVPLAGVSDSNFFEVPTDGGITSTLTVLHNNIIVSMNYAPATGESLSTAEPKLAAFAQTISNAKGADKPTDMTGTMTFVGKPLTDVCRRTNLIAVGQAIDAAHFRTDQVIDDSIYGSGETVGAVSDCEVALNTAHDRAINKNTNDIDKYYGRQLTLRTSTYKDDTTARNALNGQQAEDKKGTTFSAITGVGDAAYKTISTFHNPDGTTTITTTYRVLRGDHIISIILAEPDDPFTNAQLGQVYKVVEDIFSK